jgi:hypothetical protein
LEGNHFNVTTSESSPPVSDEQVLALLREQKRSMHVGELCARLGVPRNEHRRLAERLSTLAEARQVIELPGGKFKARRARTGASERAPSDSAQRNGASNDAEYASSREPENASRYARPRTKQDLRTGRLTINPRGSASW